MEFLKNERAFTLIEVMTSLVILLILILAFSGAFINSLRSETRIDKRLEIQRVTNSIVEELKADRDDFKNTEINNEYELDIYDKELESGNGNVDILIGYEEHKDFTNLYLVEIKWPENNYSLEILLAGE